MGPGPEGRGSAVEREINGSRVAGAGALTVGAGLGAPGRRDQLEVPVAVALGRLRAYAGACGRQVAEVAADVVARRLRFDAGDM